MLNHRKPRIAYPNALPGTCKYCGHPASSRASRSHKTCREKYSEKVSYREAAERREGKHQRCVDCKKVDGEWVTIDGKRVRVKVTRDHVKNLALNGPHEWTAPRCVQCHQHKTTEDNRRTKQWRDGGRRAPRVPKNRRTMETTKRRPSRGKSGGGGNWSPVRLLVGLAVLGVGVAMATGKLGQPDPGEVLAVALRWLKVAAIVAVIAIPVYVLLRLRKRHRADQIYRITDVIAREMRADPTQVRLKVKRWTWHQMPIVGRAWYTTTFNDDDPAERAKVEAVLQRKIGYRLDVRWAPERDTFSWRPAADQTPQSEPSPAAEQTTGPDPAEEMLVPRLLTGIEAVLGKGVTVEVTAWHTEPDDTAPTGHRVTSPESITICYPASAKVHDDKVVDDVEEKMESLLPGRWRAEWDTKHDKVVFTDTPDPLADIVTGLPLADGAPVDKLVIGRLENGKLWQIMLAKTPHLLVSGASGAGKGSVLWSIVRALMPGILAGTAEVWGIDPKGIELSQGRGVFRRYACTLETEVKLLEDAIEYLNARKLRMSANKQRDHVPTPGDPTLYILIDEIGMLTLYGADKKTRDRIGGMLGEIITQGRALGVCLVGALQDPRKEVIKIRDLFPGRIALRVSEASHCDLVLGPGSRAAGARADKIPEEMAGIAYMVVDGVPKPSRGRLGWVDNAEIERMDLAVTAARAAGTVPTRSLPTRRHSVGSTGQLAPRRTRRKTGRHRPMWMLVDIDDLRDGDVVILEFDGEPHEVELEGRPVESPDDETSVELSWKAVGGRSGVVSLDVTSKVERRPA